ncbi:DAK2 domain-containing protein [Pseudoflavonifractor sp. AF19-9AC]|uniref:DAK2 domain-containing protein n=1 Tax=Pseudoflavonifractor sp. AF19-9AC TaxID=2292244 RepID=UPI000E4F5643|nr:DAK2 domain-containing protein [Pseudoflavonifractor sp. AF19-9AC]RHR04650.1 DAK2 domain-containing protein [Pseudoflavonifractor sp. AF19-9AC]
MIQNIDAAAFQRMVVHGAAAINAQKQAINDLNVFPVPDGDTGTNMSLTIGAAVPDMQNKRYDSVGQAAQGTASALLRGARGNSGVILSLLFRGFAKAIKEKEIMDGRDLAIALDFGVAAAYKAVMKPAEGTILTVSRLAAARAAGCARENDNLEAVLEAAIEEGHKALDNTINQNPVLKKAGVVDAGGKGFLVILQGMLDELRGLPMPEMASEEEKAPADKAEFGVFSTEEIKFGYCTEFICSRDTKKDPELLRGFCSNLGDSLVLVDDDDIIKVHVHTNDPGLVLQEALTYGALLKVKIENMREQHTEILEEAAQSQQPAAPVKAAPEKKFGYVAVCAGAGLEAVFRDLGVDGLVGGGQTMNPSTEDILKEIDATPAEIVFVLPNNKNIIMAAQQCERMCEDKKVVIIPTKTVPQGIAAMLAVDPDASEEDNTAAMNEAFGRVRTSEITYAARDSDFGGFAIKQGDYLALEEGQLFGTDQELDTLLDRLAHSDSHQEAEFISIFYGQDVTEEQAQQAEKLFAAACPNAEVSLLPGGQPVYYYMISAE